MGTVLQTVVAFHGDGQPWLVCLKPNVCRQMRIDFTESLSEEATEVPEKEEKAIDYPTLF